ncbi:uncharacterized protein THITE_2110842 [Thermothielavioides terrestris NRRL 8126]|uniref:Uncharacterized protein n=1 Tax=Thermothielavioides terrestris (strain ATCC 38088 / NRRL 8126) TaxID=578455 RepID=G2QUL0_THETT|nr:uncharacterized protein THITE_2110842 [Thermothielavioides terrestris NRRL 8126]AEO64565.1 hypothetical protein THITE_2110842 [Thermothielavioides terrestris NRRL 8126]
MYLGYLNLLRYAERPAPAEGEYTGPALGRGPMAWPLSSKALRAAGALGCRSRRHLHT